MLKTVKKKKKRKRAVIAHNDQISADQSFLNHWMR